MKIFLYIVGGLSSFILISSGISMNSIESAASAKPFGSRTINEVFYNNIGTGFIGLGFFTGPTLIALANLSDKSTQK